jgi:hypothetical protein
MEEDQKPTLLQFIEATQNKKCHESITYAELFRLRSLIGSQSTNSVNTQPSARKQTKLLFSKNLQYWENDVDPFWFLTKGPFIIFPTEMIPHLTLADFVEYYRAYPSLNWSKYPQLFRAILRRLTSWERANIVNMASIEEQNRDHKRELYQSWKRRYTIRDLFDMIVDLLTLIASYFDPQSYSQTRSTKTLTTQTSTELAKYYLVRLLLYLGLHW